MTIDANLLVGLSMGFSIGAIAASTLWLMIFYAVIREKSLKGKKDGSSRR